MASANEAGSRWKSAQPLNYLEPVAVDLDDVAIGVADVDVDRPLDAPRDPDADLALGSIEDRLRRQKALDFVQRVTVDDPRAGPVVELAKPALGQRRRDPPHLPDPIPVDTDPGLAVGRVKELHILREDQVDDTDGQGNPTAVRGVAEQVVGTEPQCVQYGFGLATCEQ